MTAFEPHPDHRPTPGTPGNPGTPREVESLPAGFDESDLRIDSLLGESARQLIEPMGLRDRVFEASVSSLPASRQPALRLVGSERDLRPSMAPIWRRVTWSRLAMAASVALAFGVGVIMLNNSPKPVNTMEVAVVNPPVMNTPMIALSASEDAAMAMSEVNGLPAGSIDQLDGQMNYLLRTADVTSLDDVRGELLTLVAALEL